ncbi:MAG: hypothetical protein GX825_02410 [Syntrophomonadaceae bacterium]|nr:hypothetical protein [Syntrophomonadaceae bacterium]
MNKKVMLIALSLALVAALVGGATMAWFTDSVVSDPVAFAAGTVLIEAGSSSITSQYFDPRDGVFVYGVESGSGDLYEIDVLNEKENRIFKGSGGYTYPYPNGLAFDNINDRLYFAVNNQDLSYYDFSLDTVSSAGVLQHSGTNVCGATFGGGYYWYIPDNSPNLYKVSFNGNGEIDSQELVAELGGSFTYGDVAIDYKEGVIYGSGIEKYFIYDVTNEEYWEPGGNATFLQIAWGSVGLLYGHKGQREGVGSGHRNWYTIEPSSGTTTYKFTGENLYVDLASGSRSVWNPGDCGWAKFIVKNVGTKNCNARFVMSGSWLEYVVDEEGETGSWVPWDPEVDVVEITLTEGNWEKGPQGYYYYNAILAPGETAELRLKVCLDGPSTGNEFQGKRFVLTGEFEAIQASHDASQEIWSWSPSS